MGLSDWIVVAAVAFGGPLAMNIAVLMELKKSQRQIVELHTIINSRMTELLAVTAGEARAEGHAAGVSAERAHDAVAL